MLKHEFRSGRALGAKKPKLKTRDLEEDITSAQYFMTGSLCCNLGNRERGRDWV
jgi:hypothetical protein